MTPATLARRRRGENDRRVVATVGLLQFSDPVTIITIVNFRDGGCPACSGLSHG
jgi:hypothetical protein